MNIIVITGPSGSGKTKLTNNLCKLFKKSIVIKTDSFYRDDILIRILSKFIIDIYDRIISIKRKELVTTLYSILKKDKLIKTYQYNFKTKKSSKNYLIPEYISDNQFIILEGIFAHRLSEIMNKKITMIIYCNEEKEICYERRLKRDISDRARTIKEVKNRFERSWNLFQIHSKNLSNDDVFYFKDHKKDLYEQLLIKLRAT